MKLSSTNLKKLLIFLKKEKKKWYGNKGIRNLFGLKPENKAIKKRIIRDIFEHKEEDYFKLVRINNLWNNNCIEYKSKGDRKILLLKHYLNKIRPYLKGIINKLKKFAT